MKQGGFSWNSNNPSKKGMGGNHRCTYCGRAYKQEWTMLTHKKHCEEMHKARAKRRKE